MYENIRDFYKTNHFTLIDDQSEGSLRPAKSVPKDGESGINKFKEFYLNTNRTSFYESELDKILGSLETNTRTQNIRIMREMRFLSEGVDPTKNEKVYTYTSLFLNFVKSGEDAGCYILDKMYSISSLDDFTMYYNFLLCVLREAAIEGYIIAYPDADEKFRNRVQDPKKRKYHRERVYDIYGFLSRGKTLDDEYTPNISYYCQAELKRLGLVIKSGERIDGMDTLELTPSGYHLLKQIDRNFANKSRILNSQDMSNAQLQIIYYGAPGSGKSHTVEKKIGYTPYRTIFHPDSDYASFVGTFKPIGEGSDIGYKFNAQVFTDAYIEAWKNPGKDVNLVIEEINRGNCAQIFGDLFQLLDRKNGYSEYPVTPNKDLKDYLAQSFKFDENAFVSRGYDDDIEKKVFKGEIMVLPSNLKIIATMNTSDQSLFPMDSAFKRRWDWEYVPICYDEYTPEEEENKAYKFIIDDRRDGDKPKWFDFLVGVNKKILDTTDSEDKQMGGYFIKNSVDLKSFVNKVMYYLWSEVCKEELHTTNNFFRYDDKDGNEVEFTFNDLFPIDTNAVKIIPSFIDKMISVGKENK